jgi:glycosyltransferase involved in cell wall biosynthesis
MKILQINKFFFLGGGTERYFFDLAELLSVKGHQVTAWSTQHRDNFPFPNQKDFAQLSDFSKREGLSKDFRKLRRIFWNRQASKKLEKIIKQEKPDIVHLHNIFSHLSPSIIFILKKYHLPIVMTLHDYKLFCPNYLFFSQGEICFDCLKKKNYRSCLYKKCLKSSWVKSLIGYLEGKWQKNILKVADKIDIFLVPSLFLKRKALEWGLPKEKVIYLPHFIETRNPFSKSRLKKNHYFLYFGRLSQEKGIGLLIKAFLEISERLPQWRLKIVGHGPEREKLENLTKGHQEIEFLGKKSGRQLKEIISEAYAVIVPSLCPETFSYSTLESFALAKPVLAARRGGIPELIKNKKTGLLFRPDRPDDLRKKIVWAIYHPREMKEIGKAAQKEAFNKYNPENHYQKLIRIYERIKNN